MTHADATFARLATEAADRADALIHGDEIVVRTADGDSLSIRLDDDSVEGVDGSGRWPWVHASVADYLAERASTANWTL